MFRLIVSLGSSSTFWPSGILGVDLGDRLGPEGFVTPTTGHRVDGRLDRSEVVVGTSASQIRRPVGVSGSVSSSRRGALPDFR
jgi:hypothetical protein